MKTMNWQFWKKEEAATQKKEAVKPKSKAREWWDAILFAVVAATLIRWLIMEAYTIPTPSMENSLLVGDFLFVSKFHYGTRTTTTPLQVPLTHQKIWFTNIPSYSTLVRLPQYRLPGISSVKREDVVVFNVPPKGLNENVDYPVDLKTNYIKRCVGIPGDVLTIKDKQISVNGTALISPPGTQYIYHIHSQDAISERNLEGLDIGIDDIAQSFRRADGTVEYLMWLTEEKAENLKKQTYIKGVTIQKDTNDGSVKPMPNPQYFLKESFSKANQFDWNGDNFGPLWIPKEGEKIAINDSTLALYGTTIKLYDHNENVKIEKGKLFVDGQEVKEYTFKQNYYFMMGDNRHNSLDSRYWGFVPEDHIVGKAFFIWLSLDQNEKFLNKVRWSRFFKLIK
jgi:signal peptidase I